MVVGKVVPDSMLKPITDIFILFGGWGGIHEKGEPWTPDRAAQLAKGKPGSAHVLEEVQKIKNPGRALKVIAFAGSLWLNELRNPGSNSMAEALQFIRSNYDSMGKIVIYGYSAGGLDALELVNYIPGCMGYYLVSSGEFYGPAGAAQHWGWRIGWRKEFVKVEVDLLVTVDAACGPSSGSMSRAIPGCVRKNINFFQTTPSDTPMAPSKWPVGSHGGPNKKGAHGDEKNIENHDVTKEVTEWLKTRGISPGQAHDHIDEFTAGSALKAIQDVMVLKRTHHGHPVHHGG
jgi:hypothetical protein